jgi:hypothetical protein
MLPGLSEVVELSIQKSDLLALIEAQAEQEARALASEFVRAAEGDREAILAALEFEQWLAESCGDLADMAEFGERPPS